MKTGLVLLTLLSLVLGGCSNPAPESVINGSSEIINNVSDSVTDDAYTILETDIESQVLNLRLVAIGDNLIHAPIYEQAFRPETGDYDFTPSYQYIRDLVYNADIAFLNQEVCAAGEEYGISTYPLFNSPKELAIAMAQYMGVDVVNQASNHSIDKGLGGLTTTLELWQQNKVLAIGVWQDPEPNGIRIWENEGLRIAFVGYTYGLNGLDLYDWEGYHIGWLDDWETMQQDVNLAKEMADLVIVSLHWGYEGNTEPNEAQLNLAQALADLNVDLIIGHHPHVIQPVEELTRADGKLMPVFYSLGNMISNQSSAPNLLGILATVDIVYDSEGARIEKPLALPLVTHYSWGYAETFVYPLSEYTAELASQHGVLSYDSRFGLTYLNDLLNWVIDPEYLVQTMP